MINALANYSLREVERTAGDEFERDIIYKSCVVTVTTANFLQLVVAAVLAWVLPGKLSFFSLLALVPLTVASALAETWLRKHVARSKAAPNWASMVIHLIPMFAAFVGIAYNAYPPADGSRSSYVIGAIVGSLTVLLLTPFIRRRQNRSDQARLDAQLED